MAFAHDREQLLVPRRLRGLTRHHPRDRALLGVQEERAEVAEEEQARVGDAADGGGDGPPGALQEAAPESRPLPVDVLSVPRRDGLQRGRVPLALTRERVALVVDVVVGGVPLAERPQLVRKVRLELVEPREQRPDLHPTFSTRTALVLKRGCFETGSQMVIVSSFAARGRPFGPASSLTSQ
jgi:hypothetical protein